MGRKPSIILATKETSPARMSAINLEFSSSSRSTSESKKVSPLKEIEDEPFTQYRFYSNPNSLTASLLEKETKDDPYSTTTLDTILVDPRDRERLAKAQPRRPYFLMIVTLIQCLVMIAELAYNYKLTGKVIETSPFNYLIGTLIQMGGRVVPCMKANTIYDIAGVTIFCPSTGIKVDSTVLYQGTNQTTCLLTDICGMGGVDSNPNQWWRFVVPIFLHGGVLHLLFNMVFQVKTGFALEIDIGSARMAAIYMITGIGSFVFSGIFSGTLSPVTGCSGALYGLVACTILDLTQNWKLSRSPWKDLTLLVSEVVVLLFIGTLPFLDNYAHFGGFVLGILCGFIFIPSINFSRIDKFRKRTMLIIGVPMLIGAVAFIFIAFYKLNVGETCTFCKYLNCIPGMPWCADKWATSQINSS